MDNHTFEESGFEAESDCEDVDAGLIEPSWHEILLSVAFAAPRATVEDLNIL
jgi:hypothetical protein